MTHAPLALASALSLALVAATELAAPRRPPVGRTVGHLAGCAAPTVGGAGAIDLPAASTGRLLVANQQSASATIVELATAQVHQIPLPGAHPHGAAISPDGRWGVVADYGRLVGPQLDGRRLFVIDMATRKVVRTIDTGEFQAVHDLAFRPGSSTRVLVTAQRYQHVIEVDIALGKVVASASTKGESSHRLALSPDGSHLFTSNEEELHVSRLTTAPLAFDAHIPLPGRPLGLAVTPDGRELWVGVRGAIHVANAATGAHVATIPGPAIPDDVVIGADGKTAAIAGGDEVHVVDVAARRIVGSIATGRAPRVRIAPDGRVAFVGLGRANAIAVVDLARRCVLTSYPAGRWPDAVSWGPATP